MRQPHGVILAGGRATRMGGGDKCRRMLGGVPILTRVLARLAPQVDQVALSANGAAHRWDDLGLPVLPDSVTGHPGPLAGVLAGLDWAATLGCPHIVTAAADTPFLPPDLVPRLLSEAGPSGLALAATQEGTRVWPQPTFGLWPVALRDDLRDALGRGLRKVTDWTGRHGAALVVFAHEPLDPFFNINTPGDLAEAEGMV